MAYSRSAFMNDIVNELIRLGVVDAEAIPDEGPDRLATFVLEAIGKLAASAQTTNTSQLSAHTVPPATVGSARTCDVLATLSKLPPVAYVDNSWDKSPGAAPIIAVKRGEMGYYPIFTSLSADELNREAGVTVPQRWAMHAGSMLGWEVPAADPANYDPEGHIKRTRD